MTRPELTATLNALGEPYFQQALLSKFLEELPVALFPTDAVYFGLRARGSAVALEIAILSSRLLLDVTLSGSTLIKQSLRVSAIAAARLTFGELDTTLHILTNGASTLNYTTRDQTQAARLKQFAESLARRLGEMSI